MKKNTKLRCFDKELDKKLELIYTIATNATSIKNSANIIAQEVWNNVSALTVEQLKESDLDSLICYLMDIMKQISDFSKN